MKYEQWEGEVNLVNKETGEVVGKQHVCIQAEDGVPMGSEMGFSRATPPDEKALLLLIILVGLTFLGAIIFAIWAIIQHFLF
ncbi:MAG: hypothetical protein A2Y82_03605 [Candidatus Buchananbacteria bacterium RBG_13_36_9]|uniref:Uncharacterized protein n=1 Tax=Candidatus Buchananbacteria bacterium RBG_13_36_9 TaxID=1797530 RepID=A0A1G1XLT5_9BACT|nr:MAG: hypothetical protein A2Y82_03605 [Candidatus Buchananbacteria bacterium RBG_13_36_9]